MRNFKRKLYLVTIFANQNYLSYNRKTIFEKILSRSQHNKLFSINFNFLEKMFYK